MRKPGLARRRAPALRPGMALLLLVVALSAGCRRLPRLDHDFEDRGVLDRLTWNCRTLLRIVPEHATSGVNSLEVRLYPAPADAGNSYPGVSFGRFAPDWSRSSALRFDVYNPAPTAVPLTVRIDDRENPSYNERFNRTFAVGPGATRVTLPLRSLVTSGQGRPLHLDSIRLVCLFVASPPRQVTIYLDALRLE